MRIGPKGPGAESTGQRKFGTGTDGFVRIRYVPGQESQSIGDILCCRSLKYLLTEIALSRQLVLCSALMARMFVNRKPSSGTVLESHTERSETVLVPGT